MQRFDASVLAPVAPSAVVQRTCPRSAALIAACRLGAGPATRPGLWPWAAARIEWPFGVFQTADLQAAQRACLMLDGSWQMADAGNSVQRLGVRLRAVGVDAAWWRPLQEGDAWDAGVVVDLARLAHFWPRRATLIVVDRELGSSGHRALATLNERAFVLPRAVRVVVVSAGPLLPFARPVGG